MKISSWNEWDNLREVVVGSATNANWPSEDPVFSKSSETTRWKKTPIPSGPVPQWIIDETNEDLQGLVDILEKLHITVHRPIDLDFVASGGMYNYCPRDRLLIAGDTIVDVSMLYPCRDQEIFGLEFLVDHKHKIVTMPRQQGMICDAANVCRLNNTWLFLQSFSGNQSAAQWLQSRFPDIKIELCKFYSGMHIDSTVVPLREGIVMLNASRITKDNLPNCLKNWQHIWIWDCVPQTFYQYPYASKWIGMNTLSVNPHTVIVDSHQIEIIKKLEQAKFTVIPHTLRHSRTLGGGFHCVTLDLVRE